MGRSRNAVLTFGLLTMNVKLSSAKDKPVEPKNLCTGQEGKEHDPTPIKQPHTCPDCGPIVDYGSLVKGIPTPEGGFALVSQEDMAEAKAEFTAEYKRALNFVPHPTNEVMAMTGPGDSLNYITPADTGGKDIYAMLLKVVTDRPDVTMATLHTPVSATNLFILTVRNGVLALEQRTRTESLREAPEVEQGEVVDRLYGMLLMSVDAMLTEYRAEDYEDGYQKHLQTLAAQAENVTSITDAPSAQVDQVADIAAKLQAMMAGAA